MYKIQIEYTTGNSFGSHDETGEVEYTWKKYEVVEENLRRIEAHYEWYRDKQAYSFMKQDIKKPSFVHDKYEWSLQLLMDDGTEQYYSTFWIGYFESLNSAMIILEDSEIRF